MSEHFIVQALQLPLAHHRQSSVLKTVSVALSSPYLSRSHHQYCHHTQKLAAKPMRPPTHEQICSWHRCTCAGRSCSLQRWKHAEGQLLLERPTSIQLPKAPRQSLVFVRSGAFWSSCETEDVILGDMPLKKKNIFYRLFHHVSPVKGWCDSHWLPSKSFEQHALALRSRVFQPPITTCTRTNHVL